MIKQVKGSLILVLIFNFQFSIAQDSLAIKIGQMLLIGMPQAKVDEKVLEEVRSGKVGSIILFENNIPAKNSYFELKKITWTYQHAAPIPLFIAIDQEGGKVNRLKEKYGFPRSISAGKLGRYALDSIQFYGETTAATLAGLGINVNFAPVVDLASNPSNPIIAKLERSFSSQPDSVALFAREFIKQHRKFGVITVLKHFPGHGSSKNDTHLGLADVTNTWNKNELMPYQMLIDSGDIDAVMTAHIVNKNLDDKGLPGTLSKKITSDLLRDRMHFNGVIFSDAMEMHAIAKNYSVEDAILLAIGAGVDILTFSHEIEGIEGRTTDKVHQIIRNLVENGTVSAERIDQSFRRIIELKKKMNGSSADFYRRELVKSRNEGVQNKVRAEENLQKAREAEKQALEQMKGMQEQLKSGKKGKKVKN